MEQRTEEWFAQRIGKVTASRVADVMATIKSGEAATRKNYRMQLVCERLTNKKEESFTNSHIERGIELEPVARSMYEINNNFFVKEVGFIEHATIPMSGCSPDGLIGDDGLIEIKCPTVANHIESITGLPVGTVPSKYIPQIQWQMACTGRDWCDYVSFNNELPDNLQLFVKRVYRDDEYIANMEKEVIAFLGEVTETVNKLGEL